MRRTHRLSGRSGRWTGLCVCIASILSSAIISASGKSGFPQSNALANHSTFDFLRHLTLHSETYGPSPAESNSATRGRRGTSRFGGGVRTETAELFVPPMPQSGSSKIVFASNRDGSMQIYVMNVDV